MSAPTPTILQALENQDTTVTFDDPLEHDMVLNMGPQHPATHGVLRLLIKLDGETIVSAVPDLGYLHRGYEKIAEYSTYNEYIPHTDRLDYLSPLANNVAYVLAVEKLAGIEAPLRAQYIRVLCAELARLASHLVWLGTMGMDVGAVTVLLWGFREREKIQDIWDLLTGVRFTTSFTRVGGLANDLSPECAAMTRTFVDGLETSLVEVEKLLKRNRIFVDRCEGVGVIPPERLVALGVTGPLLRASGVDHDLRRDDPYLVYDRLDFEVPVYGDGDVLARFYVRIEEMRESVKILRQVLETMPAGPVNASDPKVVPPSKAKTYSRMEELIHDFMIVNFGIDPPTGEAYQAIESSKGELGFYLVSNGEGHPWRLKIRSPSFCNLQAMPPMLIGGMISDVVAVIGSVDPVMGEADK